MKTTMCIQLGLDSAYVEDPPHVPQVGSEVVAKIGSRQYKGIVVAVAYDYSAEDELFITVTAR